MIIAVNTRNLSGDTTTAKFLFDAFINIAVQNPSHQFVFVAEKDIAVPSLDNVRLIVIKQQSGNPLLWKLWYNYKLPLAVKKIKADVLISLDGICSLRIKLPQCLVVNDIEFLHHPEWYDKKYSGFFKSNITPCLQKATTVVTFSEHIKNEITNKYKTAVNKIEVVYPGANKNYQPVDWKESEKIKEKYTDGNEYFLVNAAIQDRSNLMNLLKAFSLFKKRQKSSMQLIIATDIIPEKDAFIESLRLYKYRNELKILSELTEDEVKSVTAAAYCCINLSSSIGDINFLLSAIQCQVPVIAGSSVQAKEILLEAAFYTDISAPAAIAEQMMLVFKDENKRNQLIRNGVEQAQKYNLDKTSTELWQKILATAEK